MVHLTGWPRWRLHSHSSRPQQRPETQVGPVPTLTPPCYSLLLSLRAVIAPRCSQDLDSKASGLDLATSLPPSFNAVFAHQVTQLVDFAHAEQFRRPRAVVPRFAERLTNEMLFYTLHNALQR